jgi:hypothetical protein
VITVRLHHVGIADQLQTLMALSSNTMSRIKAGLRENKVGCILQACMSHINESYKDLNEQPGTSSKYPCVSMSAIYRSDDKGTEV